MTGIVRDIDRQLREIGRGAAEVISPEDLRKKIARSIETDVPLRVKAGFDPTAPDLHLGHTVLISQHAALPGLRPQGHLPHRRLHRADRRPHREERHPPAAHAASRSPRTPRPTRSRSSRSSTRTATEVRFNSEWLGTLTFADVVRLAAAHDGGPDAGARRLQAALPRQHAHRHPRVPLPAAAGLRLGGAEGDVELGGTDQMFNLLVGRDLHAGLRAWSRRSCSPCRSSRGSTAVVTEDVGKVKPRQLRRHRRAAGGDVRQADVDHRRR